MLALNQGDMKQVINFLYVEGFIATVIKHEMVWSLTHKDILQNTHRVNLRNSYDCAYIYFLLKEKSIINAMLHSQGCDISRFETSIPKLN